VGLDYDVVVATMTKVGDLGRLCWLQTPPLGSMVAPLGPRASSRRQQQHEIRWMYAGGQGWAFGRKLLGRSLFGWHVVGVLSNS
jgi:hypothetical protein